MNTKTETPQGVGTEDLLAGLKAEVERTRKELWGLPNPCDFNVIRASQENYNYARHQLTEYLSANNKLTDAGGRECPN